MARAVSLNHGIALSSNGSVLFASSSEAAYSWDYDSSTMSATNNRTLVTVPSMLLISRGSTSNVDLEAADITSGHSQIKAFNLNNLTSGSYDYNTDGLRLGWGLRNSVGVAEHPTTGGIWSVENSVDQMMRDGEDIHEDNPGEEMNFHGFLNGTFYAQQGQNYGYPWCFAAWNVSAIPNHSNLTVGKQFAIDPTDGQSRNDSYCAAQVPPQLTFQAHMAPLDIKFNNSGSEVWVTFHGSWDRTDPVGYKLSLIEFDEDNPVPKATSLTAATDIFANIDNSVCPDQCFRPLIHQIASHILNEASLKNLGLSSKTFALSLLSFDSGIWCKRFLQRYDFPMIKDVREFGIAYRIRHLALNRYMMLDFNQPGPKEKEVLHTLLDLILESYNGQSNRKYNRDSKNISILSPSLCDETSVNWFFRNSLSKCRPKSRIHGLSITIRLTLSYLLLDPTHSYLAKMADSSNYDVTKIYLFEMPFSTICTYEERNHDFVLNKEDLVHILNFWNYHLCGSNQLSYRYMADKLAEKNRLARPWSEPLQAFHINFVPTRWIGHYTCIHPLPSRRDILEEIQTCGETWDVAHPMILDFSEDISGDPSNWWPWIFKSMPAWKMSQSPSRYVRGMAAYLPLSFEQNVAKRKGTGKGAVNLPQMAVTETSGALDKLRLQGVIQPLPDQEKIPGWSRIMFVLYRPTQMFVLNALWTYFNDKGALGNMPTISNVLFEELRLCWDMHMQHNQWILQQAVGVDEMKLLMARTAKLLSDISSLGLTCKQVAEIEDNFQGSKDLQWVDIDYAYAYEGVLTPGGKVMLGRFWALDKVQLFGLSNVQQTSNESAETDAGHQVEQEPALDLGVIRGDLGSFVFWAENQ
ncbi:putative soluble quinoprotein glucose dehydrogenase [Phaeomoniella chlamydospora]|uniref:Putative soluble quinoprotein glucose dehydrogenase n=1 Tax=Phaeomoniella chlamydospora TaxID=158046 RepID=A0A0G2HAV6_PHACM|nr:putative soluble quinoprotein glucose dehydrogenase [Phaeomoniella chlamydospora]